MNEIQAAGALGEIGRARKAAGLPGLNEFEAARFLAEMAELRQLSVVPASVTLRIPAPRRPSRRGRMWLSRQ
jgi:hypothetical protein